MKEEINLLPPNVQTKRLHRIYQQRARRIYGMVVMGLILVLLAYGSAWWVLRLVGQNLETPAVSAGGADIATQVTAQNELLRAIEAQTKEPNTWLLHTHQALQQLPDAAQVTAIELTRIVLPPTVEGQPAPVQHALVLEGQATSRTAVVEYERKLQALPWVGKVEAPLKNFANADNISFSFTLFLKEDTL